MTEDFNRVIDKARMLICDPNAVMNTTFDEDTGYTYLSWNHPIYGFHIEEEFYSRHEPESAVQECITKLIEDLQIRIEFAEKYMEYVQDSNKPVGECDCMSDDAQEQMWQCHCHSGN